MRARISSQAVWLEMLALTFCIAMTFAAERDEEKFSKAAIATANKREAQIRAEIKALGKHEWVGEYYFGDGLGVNVSVVIAPKHGYVFRWHGCLGLYDQNYGTVTSADGRIRLSFTFESQREGFQGIAQEFVPVKWGGREYLIPSDDIVGFCNQINEGSEPRHNDILGRYLLRKGDEKQNVTGFPNVPEQYQAYLLRQPIEAAIVTIGPSTTRASVAEWKFIDTTVTLSSGKIEGLLPGMELLVTEPGNLMQSVRITKVEDDNSEAVMTQSGEDEPGPKVGMRLSTRAPWHRAEAKESTDK
jgi:hypothetical protein